MKRIAVVAACFAFCFLLASITRAQVSMRSMSTRVEPTSAAAAAAAAAGPAPAYEGDCSDFINNPKPIREDFQDRKLEILSCAAALRRNIPDPGVTATSKAAALVTFKANYRGLST